MTITLHEAPAIPGLRFRAIRRPADDAAIAGVGRILATAFA
jgi:hypothetical protein